MSKKPGSLVLVIAAYSILAVVLTYPLIFNLATAVPSDIGDPLLNTWILAWDTHALLTDPLNLFNANIFYPLPNTLAYSEHLFSTALLALPLQLSTGEPVTAYNLSLLFSFPLAALGMYLLALRWTHRPDAAFIAGLVFAFNPYRFAAIAHLQLLTFQWLPFVVLSLEQLLDTDDLHRAGQTAVRRRAPKGSWALALLVFLVLQMLASWYLAIYTGLILVVFGLLRVAAKGVSAPMLARLSVVGLLAALAILPFARPYLALAVELNAARPLALALTLAAHPLDYLTAAPFNQVFGQLTAPLRDRPGFTEEHVLFPGFVALVLALSLLLALPVSTFRRGVRVNLLALLLVLLLCLVLTFPAPYKVLAAVFPASTIVRVPSRWIIPALFALAGLSAYGYRFLGIRWGLNAPSEEEVKDLKGQVLNLIRPGFSSPVVLFALCAGLLLLESFSAPLPLAEVANRATLNRAYHWLAARPQEIALVELPLHSAPAPEYPEVKRLYASTLGWWGLANGYSGYTPPRQPGLAQDLNGFPDEEAINALYVLAGSRPLYLLVHPDEAPLDRLTWENVDRWRAERHPALRPIGQFAGDTLYQVIPRAQQPVPGRRLASFGFDGQIQLTAAAIDRTGQAPSSRQQPDPSHGPTLRLSWQATGPILTSYTVFVHLRAPDGFVVQQADGPPVSGHYPTTEWAPHEVVQDIHPLPPVDFGTTDHIAVGLYDPATGERLPAFGPGGERLAEDAVIIPGHEGVVE